MADRHSRNRSPSQRQTQQPASPRGGGGGKLATAALALAAGAVGAGLVYAKPWTWVGGAAASAGRADGGGEPMSCCARPPDGPPGMAWVAGGTFHMGDAKGDGMEWEQPVHQVSVDGFYVDTHEVTNAQFRAFVDATKYVTTAERKPDLREIMKQLPPGSPPPPAENLKPGSLVFHKTAGPVPTDGHSWFQWWRYVPGADWRHPDGPNSTIDGKDHHPVVQVSWDDAAAYCAWAGKRLPTEAEWEYAARGGLAKQRNTWGSAAYDPAKPQANIWQGEFPHHDTKADGFDGPAPVGSFPANGYGLHDMAGNVWEWTSDWFDPAAYAHDAARGIVNNPAGPDRSRDPDGLGTPKRAIRGGSFLCNDSYCSSYRPSARMHTSPDSATNHQGFRCVTTKPMWEAQKAKLAAAREAAAAVTTAVTVEPAAPATRPTTGPAAPAPRPEVQSVNGSVRIPTH